MDKFCFITDTHFSRKGPSSRTDDYFESLLEKLDYVVEFCKAKKIRYLLHGGDFFDSPYVSDYVAGIVAKILKKSGLQVYSILGQHDITGKNRDSYVNGKIHLFESYEWFNMIGGKYLEFENVIVTGIDYDADMACPTEVLVEKHDKLIICLLHAMITSDRDLIINGERKFVRWDTINTNADVILTGDYHLGYKPVEHALLKQWCNPGSFARTNVNDKQGIGPGLVYIKANINDIKLIWHKIPCKNNVFKVKEVVSEKEECEKFERAFKELQEKDILQANIVDLFEMLIKGKKKNVNKDIVQLCKLRLKELLDARSKKVG